MPFISAARTSARAGHTAARDTGNVMAAMANLTRATAATGARLGGAEGASSTAPGVRSAVRVSTRGAHTVPARLGSSVRGARGAHVSRAADDAGSEGPAADGASGPSDGLAFEPKSKSKRKRRDGKNTRRAKITVEGAAIEAAKGTATPTIQSATEEAYILFLFGYVVVIFLGGLVLAGSAFKIFPDNIERWVSDTLYPAYSPTVIGFLVFSSVYGLVKTRNDPNSAVGK
jgi:hypothetical protein